MKFCEKCGSQMNDDAVFCAKCGTRLPNRHICNSCGTFVKNSNLLEYEVHDYTDWDEAILGCDYDDLSLPEVVEAKPLETEYYFSDCPRDKVIETYIPTALGKVGNATVYDVGLNMSGIPVLRSLGKKGKI